MGCLYPTTGASPSRVTTCEHLPGSRGPAQGCTSPQPGAVLQELRFLVLRLPLPPLVGLPTSKTPFLSQPPESKGNPAPAISHSGPRGGVGARFAQDLGTSLLVSGHCLCPSSLPCGANRPVLLTKETGRGGGLPNTLPACCPGQHCPCFNFGAALYPGWESN